MRRPTLALAPLLLMAMPVIAAPKLCALMPHIKDSYWLSVNQGLVEQAQQQGALLKVLEAGGYHNLEQQISQFKTCQRWGADVVLLGSVSYRLSPEMVALVQQTPTIAMINRVDEPNLIGSVGVSWKQMGRQVGSFVNQHYQQRPQPVKALLMMGPKTNGGSNFLEQGISETANPEALKIVGVLNGGNSVAIQRRLLRQYLQDHPLPELIIGGAVATEVAVSELRSMGVSDQVDLISTYMSHGVCRGLMRNRILMANTDGMREQGRLAVIQAMRYLDGETIETKVGPKLLVITPQSDQQWLSESLSDPNFRPTYSVP